MNEQNAVCICGEVQERRQGCDTIGETTTDRISTMDTTENEEVSVHPIGWGEERTLMTMPGDVG